MPRCVLSSVTYLMLSISDNINIRYYLILFILFFNIHTLSFLPLIFLPNKITFDRWDKSVVLKKYDEWLFFLFLSWVWTFASERLWSLSL